MIQEKQWSNWGWKLLFVECGLVVERDQLQLEHITDELNSILHIARQMFNAYQRQDI